VQGFWVLTRGLYIAGGQGVAGSNPVSPTTVRRGFAEMRSPCFACWGRCGGGCGGTTDHSIPLLQGWVEGKDRIRVFILFRAGPKGCQVAENSLVRILPCGTPPGGCNGPAPGSVRREVQPLRNSVRFLQGSSVRIGSRVGRGLGLLESVMLLR